MGAFMLGSRCLGRDRGDSPFDGSAHLGEEGAGLYVFADEGNGGLEGCAGAEDGGDAVLFEVRDVFFGDGSAQDQEDVFGVLGYEQVVDAGEDGVVGSGEDGEADAVDVLLDGGGDDHLGSLAEAGVDDLHASVAEGAGDDLCTTVVAVEAGLGYKDADGCGMGHRSESILGGLTPALLARDSSVPDWAET